MEQYTTFIVIVAVMVGYFLGHACAVSEFNEQRQARARIRRAMRERR